MNKLLSLGVMTTLALSALANDSSSDLVFRFKDGAEQSISAQNLVMNINDGTLVADNGVMNINVDLASLQKFFFGAGSGINSISQTLLFWNVYTIDGRWAGHFSSLEECQTTLPAGIYVAKNNSNTFKIAIR